MRVGDARDLEPARAGAREVVGGIKGDLAAAAGICPAVSDRRSSRPYG
ncbi:hypothetical protein HRW07_27420 [Streptomyces lunaelactis]|nr:hypothetical protein [Streptomyces lunaelactis]